MLSTLITAVLNLSTLYSMYILELLFVHASITDYTCVHMYVTLVIEDESSKLSYHVILHPLAIALEIVTMADIN